MARKPITDMSAWPSLSLEGNLIAPAMIAKIDQRQAPEQSVEEYGVRKGLQIREEIATENGGGKLDHGSGGIVLLRAA